MNAVNNRISNSSLNNYKNETVVTSGSMFAGEDDHQRKPLQNYTTAPLGESG